MNKKCIKILPAVLVCCLISACGIGQKKVLFTTRSNIGLDVDAKQFTAQLNIDRQEAVIGPTFEGGQHVPIAAAFTNSNRFLGGFGVSSLFAGGAAALALTQSPTNHIGGLQKKSLLKLSKAPVFHRGPIGKFFDSLNPFKDATSIEQDKSLPGPGEVKPFIFDTDTSLGIKLAWSGSTGGVPDKVQIGFNREEFALAPVMQSKENPDHSVTVSTPSFFAALDTNTEFDSIISEKTGFRQVFAVGDPATRLAANPGIRASINERFELGDAGLCLNKWLDPKNDIDTAKKRLEALNQWLNDASHNTQSVDELVNDPFKWKAFASKNITSGYCMSSDV